MSSAQDRILVLSVDRDGDLERKTRIRTPIIGRDSVMAAATSLALSDPEEADANALFAAVNEYDELRTQEVECDVAAVTGLEESDYKADRKIRKEVETLLSKKEYTGIVLISDGVEDERIIPILQTLKPIVSVRRVAVKHSKSVEENYMVLGRYLRMLVFEPRYSKWAIGVPGVILLFVGLLALAGAGYLAGLSVLIILGSAFLIRGFNIDRFIAGLLSQKPYGYIRLFSIPASILVLIVALSSGYANMIQQAANLIPHVGSSPSLFLADAGILVGYYMQGSLLLIWAAIGIYIAGTVLTQFLRGSHRAWRGVTGIAVLMLLFFPMDQFSVYLVSGGTSSSLLLITYVLLGLAVVFAVVVTLYTRLRSRPPPPTTAIPTLPVRIEEHDDHDDHDPQEDHQD